MQGYFLSTRHMVMYPDCNATDNLFGGRLLAWIDEGAAMYAACQMKTNRVVTRSFGDLPFKVPIERGSIVSIYCKTQSRGNTSIIIECVVTKREHSPDTEVEVAKTALVFVALDNDGKPTRW